MALRPTITSADLLEALRDFDPASLEGDEPERVRVRESLTEALRKVQSPWDVAWELCWVNMTTTAAIKTLFDIDLFNKWHNEGWRSLTTPELAALTGVDPKLLRRLLRHLAANHLLQEVGPDTYGPTPWARAFVAYPFLAGPYGNFQKVMKQACNGLPAFLASTAYVNPSDPGHGNFHFNFGDTADPWHVLVADPEVSKDFNQSMESHSRFNLQSWTSIYPTETIIQAAKERKAEGSGVAGEEEGQQVLVVDVGGNKGYDLEKFRSAHPKDCPPASLILQDLPVVLRVTPELHPAIKSVEYDFFTAQTVRGARAYFIHNVIHDWGDEAAVKILKNVSSGFEKGYSRLLLHESVVDEVKPKAKVTTLDLTMMAWFSAKERTEAEWKRLLEAAGLRLIKVWRPKAVDTSECILEATLA